MNVPLLIDAIVRQTTVLVAQLATAGGVRAALGHTANQVFIELSTELKRQGLSNKLIADLFGLSLRTYHNKIRRLSESSTDRGRPLWNAVLDFIQSQGAVARAEVLMRFCRDDSATVKSVLNDLVDSGLVFGKGKGEHLVYRAASAAELNMEVGSDAAEAREHLVWILIARHSPLGRKALLELSQLEPSVVDQALSKLLADGRVTHHASTSDVYASSECVLPLGQTAGWEAAVFDHYQAVVTAICSKLASGTTRAEHGEHVGGSTYSVEVWPGHPLFAEALGQLQALRDNAQRLRQRVDELNRTLVRPNNTVLRVVTYVGQSVNDSNDNLENEI